MRARRLLCRYLVFCMLSLAAHAGDGVSLERRDGVFHVDVAMSVAADATTAWQVLTDYDHLAEFVPGMRESRVVNADPLQIEQTGSTGLLVFSRDFDVTLQLKPLPPTRLEFRAVHGVKSMAGYWNIAARPDGTILLEYVADIAPDFWVPPLLGTALLRRQLRQNVEGVAAEMHRRYGAARLAD